MISSSFPKSNELSTSAIPVAMAMTRHFRQVKWMLGAWVHKVCRLGGPVGSATSHYHFKSEVQQGYVRSIVAMAIEKIMSIFCRMGLLPLQVNSITNWAYAYLK